jgi:hypothetical protein
MTNPLRNGIGRVDGLVLLRVLDYISKHGGSSCEERSNVRYWPIADIFPVEGWEL